MVPPRLLLLAALVPGALAFAAPRPAPRPPSSTAVRAAPADASAPPPSRRAALARFGSLAAAASLALVAGAPVLPASAATGPPSPAELARIQTGYDNLQYLLKNWERETTVCRENGGECKRDAEPVRKYMGLRSTTDPLFQIEKVFAKVRFMEDLDPDRLEDFFEATEGWNTAMNMSNSMAFISQFAEYNPGGGKDEVLKYLDEAETQVKLAEKSLRSILDYVNSKS